uniref:Uncharacterized protein n=1 Tax=Anguilla anguilla TaxID=7936 RepID=A0A0E9QSK3_ANGAN
MFLKKGPGMLLHSPQLEPLPSKSSSRITKKELYAPEMHLIWPGTSKNHSVN